MKNIRKSLYNYFNLRPGLDYFEPNTDTSGLDLNLATSQIEVQACNNSYAYHKGW